MSTDAEYERELRERAARARLDAIVKAATDAVAADIASAPPRLSSHFFYGATGVHPRPPGDLVPVRHGRGAG